MMLICSRSFAILYGKTLWGVLDKIISFAKWSFLQWQAVTSFLYRVGLSIPFHIKLLETRSFAILYGKTLWGVLDKIISFAKWSFLQWQAVTSFLYRVGLSIPFHIKLLETQMLRHARHKMSKRPLEMTTKQPIRKHLYD